MNADFDETTELELANDDMFDDGLDDLLWEDQDLYSLLGFSGDRANVVDADRLAA